MSTPTINPVSFTIRRPTPNTDSENEGFKVPKVPSQQSLSRKKTGTSSPLALPPTRPPKRTTTSREDSDSDGDDGGTEDEIITGFDKFGVTRCVLSLHDERGSGSFTKVISSRKAPRKKEAPPFIPAVKNKDWRAIARARNAPSFVPN